MSFGLRRHRHMPSLVCHFMARRIRGHHCRSACRYARVLTSAVASLGAISLLHLRFDLRRTMD